MRFGFLLKRGKPEARELAATLAEVLVARGASLVALAEDAGAVPGATSGDVRKAASCSMLARAIRPSMASSAAAHASRCRPFAVSSPLMRKVRCSS